MTFYVWGSLPPMLDAGLERIEAALLEPRCGVVEGVGESRVDRFTRTMDISYELVRFEVISGKMGKGDEVGVL